MTVQTYQLSLDLSLNFEQILNLVRQLPSVEQEKIRQEIEKGTTEQQSSQHTQNDFLITFDQIGREAQEKGLTEEILAGLLADES
jgi:hypothetical protein